MKLYAPSARDLVRQPPIGCKWLERFEAGPRPGLNGPQPGTAPLSPPHCAGHRHAVGGRTRVYPGHFLVKEITTGGTFRSRRCAAPGERRSLSTRRATAQRALDQS